MSAEELGITDILKQLDEDSLSTLARTVTQGLMKINSTEDAIKGILKYSADTLSILRRKAVTRDVLFAYLDVNNVEMKLPITKNEMIDKIMEYWNIKTVLSASSNELSNKTDNLTVESKQSNSISALAEQFVNWFYSLMNGEGVGSEHFYPDAKLKINLYSNNDCETTLIENNPEEISLQLSNIKIQHNLYFNANVTKDGTQGRMNPHGLVMVLACGTLHIQETCVGLFEQVFALARDPFCDNNWKIKNSELNLRSQKQVTGQPRLCESELASEFLELPYS